jgi:hypothetical protein
MHFPFWMTCIGPVARDFFAPEQTPQGIILFSLRCLKEWAANPGNVPASKESEHENYQDKCRRGPMAQQ